MGWVLRFLMLWSVCLVWAGGEAWGEGRGYLYPDLLALRFFVGVRGNDELLLESVWVEGEGIVFEGLDGKEVRGRSAVGGYFREWLSGERVDIQVHVTDLDVRTKEGYVGGTGAGYFLDLKTGLSHRLRVGFEGYLEGCGEGMWCFRRLRLFEVENGE